MINLVRDIRANARNFQELPLGPVGSFVKVKDESREWRLSIENAIGGWCSGSCHVGICGDWRGEC
jgi:hypothetical protein